MNSGMLSIVLRLRSFWAIIGRATYNRLVVWVRSLVLVTAAISIRRCSPSWLLSRCLGGGTCMGLLCLAAALFTLVFQVILGWGTFRRVTSIVKLAPAAYG